MAEPHTSAQILPESIRREIDRLSDLYPNRQALLIPVLHLAQRHWDGWLPDEAIYAVAEALDLPPAEVFGVVTFYDLFHQRPVGRHRIRVCTNLSCQLRGAEEILAAIGEELAVEEGEVTPNGRCSYVHFECLGSCDTAPMMMVDDDYHESLTPEVALQIVRELK